MGILFILIVLATFENLNLLKFLTHYSDQLLENCLKWVPDNALFEINSALICGNSLQDSATRDAFIKTGIYHALVVSGTHLSLIIFWMSLALKTPRLKKLSSLLTPLSFYYVLMTGLQAPVLRAWFFLLSDQMDRDLKLGWSIHFKVLVSLLLTLVFKPTWSQSYSLLLSTVAIHSIIALSDLFKRNGLIFLLNLPVLAGWGFSHPISLLGNILLAPVLNALVPLALLSSVLPQANIILAPAYQLFIDTLKELTLGFALKQNHQELNPPQQLWPIYLLVFAGVHISNILRKRKLCKQ